MKGLRGEKVQPTTRVTSTVGHDFGIIPTDPRAVEKVAGAAIQSESLPKKEKTDPISHTPTTPRFYSVSVEVSPLSKDTIDPDSIPAIGNSFGLRRRGRRSNINSRGV